MEEHVCNPVCETSYSPDASGLILSPSALKKKQTNKKHLYTE